MAHDNLGVAYSTLGRWRDAVAAFQQATRLQSDNAQAHYNLGVAYDNLGRLQEAVAAFQQAIRLRPKDAQAHYNLGVTYLMLGDQESAFKEYTILKPLDPHLATDLLRSVLDESP